MRLLILHRDALAQKLIHFLTLQIMLIILQTKQPSDQALLDQLIVPSKYLEVVMHPKNFLKKLQ